ncbi:MAG: hypothetical protein KC506_00700 [Nanoarchaeota archaeon]|nr:hypothetical protein [Nanoarchaeota archaeon]
MAYKNLLVLLVSVFALAALFSGSVSAFGNIVDVELNGVDVLGGTVDLSNFGGDRIPVEIEFLATADASDVRFKASLIGASQSIATSERISVFAGNTYKRTIYLDVPNDLKNDIRESQTLEIVVEGEDTALDKFVKADEKLIDFSVQRESYNLEILSVTMQPEVNVGEPLVLDVVLKNRGLEFADDTFLELRIPELGLETRTYFGDLSATDQSDPDKEDAVERRTYLRIPANVEPGLYTVELEAFNSDSHDRVERRVLVVGGAVENTLVVSASQSKNFAVGETGMYKMTVVNRGTVVRVFELVVTSPEGLNVDLSDALVVVPAGSSRTVEISADSMIRDDYTFSVDVLAVNGSLVESKTFRANVEDGNGRRSSGSSSSTGVNTTVLLTIILAIIFVVLLVVLIVLLTRKPETKEEFGESYY